MSIMRPSSLVQIVSTGMARLSPVREAEWQEITPFLDPLPLNLSPGIGIDK
jgi:hypothetical protein